MVRPSSLAVFLVMLSACGATSSSDAGAPDGGAADAGAPRTFLQADGGVVVGPLALDVELETIPVQRTGNLVHNHLSQADGGPVEGASVTVALWLPAHGHGAPAPTVSDEGDGHYHAEPVNFPMAGTWELTTTAKLGALEVSQKITVDVP